MDDQTRVVLVIASRLLSYPTDAEAIRNERNEMEDWIRTDIKSRKLKSTLSRIISDLYAMPIWELRELYVDTFDLKEKAGLYLTAHELGDSRKRGIALIELQQLIIQAGFVSHEDELADYMPMLYELLALSENNEPMEQLMQRLAVATERIREHLIEDNPYRSLFAVLMDYVFEQPLPQMLEKLEQGREQPDLGTMPYPLMYM